MKPLLSALVLLSAVPAYSQVRQWTNTDGKTIEAEYLGVRDSAVILKLKDGREVPVEMGKLSPADQEFAKSNGKQAPAPTPKAAGTGKSPGFHQVILDKKAWTLRTEPDDFGVTGVSVSQQLETPHFLIIATPKVKPAIMEIYAEACERLFSHIQKDLPLIATRFGDRKMTVWLTADAAELKAVGEGLKSAGANPYSWGTSSIVGATFSKSFAEKKKVVTRARFFNTERDASSQRNPLWPERLHFMGSTLIYSLGHNFSWEGYDFAMFNLCYAYFLENDISGKVETKVSFNSGTSTVEGFKNPKGWPGGVKRLLATTPLKPSLKRFLTQEVAKAEPMDVGAGFGLMHFIFRDPARVAALNTILETAIKDKEPPTEQKFAQAMGYASPEEFDVAWLDFLKSDSFK